jgi:hypothetical protein
MGISYLNPDYIISNAIDIIQPSGRYTIPLKSIEAPGSIRYHYESWIYINENTPVDVHNVLFNRGNDFVLTLKGSTLTIFADNAAQPISQDGVYTPLSNPTMVLEITKQFPFQKWCHLVINVDGRTIDVYIDGKLVKTSVMPNVIPINVDNIIQVGNKNTRGKIARFKRIASNISPQDVYLAYNMGSGQSSSNELDYHVNIGISKDNVMKRQYKLF